MAERTPINVLNQLLGVVPLDLPDIRREYGILLDLADAYPPESTAMWDKIGEATSRIMPLLPNSEFWKFQVCGIVNGVDPFKLKEIVEKRWSPVAEPF